MRCTTQVNLGGAMFFAPSTLPDAMMASGVLKRAAAGAAFLGRFSKINSLNRAKIVWDTMVKPEPPAALKPNKPKLYLMRSTTLEPNIFYKLE